MKPVLFLTLRISIAEVALPAYAEIVNRVYASNYCQFMGKVTITIPKSISLPLRDALSAMGWLFRYRSICGIMATLLTFEVPK